MISYRMTNRPWKQNIRPSLLVTILHILNIPLDTLLNCLLLPVCMNFIYVQLNLQLIELKMNCLKYTRYGKQKCKCFVQLAEFSITFYHTLTLQCIYNTCTAIKNEMC